MSRLSRMAIPLIEHPLAPAPPVECLQRRSRRRRRRQLSATTSVLVMIGLLIGIALWPSNAKQLPGLSARVVAFTSSGPPHLLNRAVAFGFLPTGMHLASDRQTNRLTKPVNYLRSITFDGRGPNGPITFTLDINQGQLNPDFTTLPPAGSISNAVGSLTTVQGHRALVFDISEKPTATITHGMYMGHRTTAISCSGPIGTAGKTLPSPCNQLLTEPAPGPPGLYPEQAAATPAATARPHLSVQWKDGSDLGFQIDSNGLSLAQLIDVAQGIVYRPALGSCILNGKPLDTGLCAPGIHSSPPSNTPLVPEGGTELAYGAVAGKPWVFSAAIEPGNTWEEIVYGKTVVTASGSTVPSTTLNWDAALNGETFLSGMVPDWITSVVATTRGALPARSAVLPTKIGHWAFFVMPMGKATVACNPICQLPVRLTFYDGSYEAGHSGALTTESSSAGFTLGQPPA